MILPTRNVVAPEMGIKIMVRQVSRQLIQRPRVKKVTIRMGSRITLLISVLSPWPNESMSLVNRAISSDEPWSEKLARSRLIDRRKNMLRMSKRRQLHHVGDQHFLEEHEEALEGHPQHDERRSRAPVS